MNQQKSIGSIVRETMMRPSAQPVQQSSNYDYYRNMYDSFAGDPTAQRSILMAYYDENSPEKQQQRQFQEQLMSLIGGQGGQTPQTDSGGLMPGMIGYRSGGQSFDATQFRNPTPEEPGTFGLGNSPGQLFGKGGLFHGVVDPLVTNATDIVNGIGGIVQTGGKTIADVMGGKPLFEDSRATDATSQMIDEISKANQAGDFNRARELMAIVKPVLDKQNAEVSALANPDNAIQNQAPILTGQFGQNGVDIGASYTDYVNDPLRHGLKNLATQASYVLPAKLPMLGAGSLGSNAIVNNVIRPGLNTAFQGTVGGGLMGAGESETGQELQGLLEGGAMGGATGFGLGAAGGAAKGGLNSLFGQPKLVGLNKPLEGKKGVGSKLAESGVKTGLDRSPGGLAAEVQLKEKAVSLLKGLDEPLNRKGVNGANTKLVTSLVEKLEKSSATTKPTNIVNSALKEAGRQVPLESTVVQNNVREWANKLFGLGDEASVKDIGNLYREIQSEMNPIYKAQQLGNPLSPSQEVTKAFHDSIGNALKKAEPKIAPIYDNLSTLHKVSGSTADFFEKGMNVNIPLTSAKIPFGTAPIDLVQGAGRLIQKAGKAKDNLFSGSTGLGSKASKVASSIPTGAAGLLPLGAVNRSQSTQTNGSRATTTPNFGTGGSQGVGNVVQTPTQTSGVDSAGLKQFLAMGVLGGQIDPATAKLVGDLLGTSEGKMLPSGQVYKIVEIEDSLNQMNDLQANFDSNRDAFNPIGGALRQANPLKGFDPQLQEMEATVLLAKQIVGKGLEGGVLRPEDEKKYAKILPQVVDSAETVQTKIDLLKKALEDKLSNLVESYESAGYNPYYGQ